MYILRSKSASQQHEGIRDRSLFVYEAICPAIKPRFLCNIYMKKSTADGKDENYRGIN